MSTRCQIRVIQEGMNWEESVTLYHHWDGYPENMIKLFKAAFELIETKDIGQAGRAGKVASYLCAVDPSGFEPEVGHELHFDIAYYYRIFCINQKKRTVYLRGCIRSYKEFSNFQKKEEETYIDWEVEILQPIKDFWDHPDEEHLEVIQERISLQSVDEMAYAD